MTRLKEEGHPQYKLIDDLLRHPRRLLISLIIGNDISNVIASALATPLAIRHFGQFGRWLAIAFVTSTIMLMCDITPKTLAISHPLSVSTFIAKPISAFVRLVTPLRWLIQKTVDLVLLAVGFPLGKKSKFILEKDFLRLVEHGHQAGVVELLERDFIKKLVTFGDTTVTAIMTPRLDIFALDVNTPLFAAVQEVKKRGFSRVPVFEDSLNHMIGILHIKDLVGRITKDNKGRVADLKTQFKPVCYVPEIKNVHDLFRDLQARHIHLALVVDEYGDLTGLVTMEDVLEELFGEIYDEYDQRGIILEAKADGTYLVSPRMPVEDFNEAFSSDLPDDEVETIGGFILSLFGKLPEEGGVVLSDGLRFTVLKVKGTRILQLKVERVAQ